MCFCNICFKCTKYNLVDSCSSHLHMMSLILFYLNYNILVSFFVTSVETANIYDLEISKICFSEPYLSPSALAANWCTEATVELIFSI